MAKVLHLDLETKSDLDLRAVGLHNYARGRATDIMCAAFAFDDEEEVPVWLPGQPVPRRVFEHIERGGEVHAHNAPFERELINCVGTRKYGWPHIYNDQLVCTMAQAYAMNLPGSLENCAAALGVEQQKDMSGRRLILQYCQPREVAPDGKIVWWEDADKLEQIYAYCQQDVRVERAIGKRMFRLSEYEQRVWSLDQKINDRGIRIDEPAARAATLILEAEKKRLNNEIQIVSGNQIATCTAVAQIKQYLTFKGVDVETLAKSDVVELLDLPNLPEDCRKVLRLRQEAGKASTAKVAAMLSRSSPSDHRVRGAFQYSGAGTRRWAGRGIQLQNLKRPTVKQSTIDTFFEGLHHGHPAKFLNILFDSSFDMISNCTRGMLIPSEGHDFIVCDFNAIEARVLAWLAGQKSTLEIFKTHGKLYEAAAADIYSKPIDDIDSTQRQVGKVAVLALGYGGGVGALQTMAKGYGVDLAPSLQGLWTLADLDTRDWVQRQFKANCHRYDGITEHEFLAAELIKTFWRRRNHAVVNLWANLEEAAIASVKNPSRRVVAGRFKYITQGSFLLCQLPGGGVISYPYPKVEEVKTPWGASKEGITYMSEDGQSKKWLRFKTYGGSLAENVTQAVSRDLLTDAMLRLEKNGYKIVAHIHDEAVCEVPESFGSVDHMAAIMCDSPLWAESLPIKASGWRGQRYRKE